MKKEKVLNRNIKVLQISMGESYGGLEKLEIEYLNIINDKNIDLDVLVPNVNALSNHKNNNNKIYTLDITRKTFFGRIKYDYRLCKFLRKNKYDIIHINSSAFFYSFRVAIIAKLCKIKKIIVHSHGVSPAGKLKKIIIKILNPIYTKIADEYLACSKRAQTSLFTNKFISKNKIKILKNGIYIDKYKFNNNIRNKYRNDLKINNKIVYGHIGRFSIEKNHEYLIDLFYEIQKKQDAVLMLVGEGPLEDIIKEKVKKLNIEDKVLFLGFRDDINNILNAIDIFILPSISEGLPVSLIEAQTNGLLIYASTGVSKETNISPFFKYFDLNDNVEELAIKITREKIDLNYRFKAYEYVKSKGYDIYDVCDELKKIYLNLSKGFDISE